jgi:hypothetical protein
MVHRFLKTEYLRKRKAKKTGGWGTAVAFWCGFYLLALEFQIESISTFGVGIGIMSMIIYGALDSINSTVTSMYLEKIDNKGEDL